MTGALKIACIGAGYFSRFHQEAWTRIEGATLVGVIDQDLAKAEATGVAAFRDLEALLQETPVDIIDIVTPPETHLDLIERACAAAPKAIVCQKPFCTGLAEARAAIRLSEAAGIPLIVHENFRFQPWYRVMKAQMASGQIGDVLQLSFRLRPGDGQGPNAYLDRQPYFQKMPRFLVHETAVHWIDTFRFLMGPPSAIFADLRQMNPAIAGEDAGHILFRYENGVRALFDGNRLLDHAAENTRCTMGEALIEGTQGTLTLKGDGSVHLRKFGDLTAQEVLGASHYEGFGGDCVYHLQGHVVRALREGTEMENLARDYLAVLAQEDAIYASAEVGAWITLEQGPTA